MTDAELRERALMARPSQARLGKLISAVDKIADKPTQGQVRWLAYAYRETPEFVQTVFDTRKERKASRTRTAYKRPDMWTDTEDRILKSMWAERNGHKLGEMLDQMSAAVNALPINRQRGIKRAVDAVDAQRIKLGLSFTRHETEVRRRW